MFLYCEYDSGVSPTPEIRIDHVGASYRDPEVYERGNYSGGNRYILNLLRSRLISVDVSRVGTLCVHRPDPRSAVPRMSRMLVVLLLFLLLRRIRNRPA